MNVVYNHDRTMSQNHAHSLRTRADTRTLWKFINESAAHDTSFRAFVVKIKIQPAKLHKHVLQFSVNTLIGVLLLLEFRHLYLSNSISKLFPGILT